MVGEFSPGSEKDTVDPNYPRVTKIEYPPKVWPPSYRWRDKGYKVSYNEGMWRIEKIPEPLSHDSYGVSMPTFVTYTSRYSSITEEELAVLVEAREDILASIASDPTSIKKMEIPKTRGINEETDSSS